MTYQEFKNYQNRDLYGKSGARYSGRFYFITNGMICMKLTTEQAIALNFHYPRIEPAA